MTSQLNVDTIVDKAGSGGSNVKMANTSTYVSDGGATTQNTVQGLAKQWCEFEGEQSTISLDDSFNTTSLTDNSTGNYNTNFTSNMTSVNYFAVGDTNAYREVNTEKRTTHVVIYVRQAGTVNTVQDSSGARCAVLGDLA
jgi:hypothetical protein